MDFELDDLLAALSPKVLLTAMSDACFYGTGEGPGEEWRQNVSNAVRLNFYELLAILRLVPCTGYSQVLPGLTRLSMRGLYLEQLESISHLSRLSKASATSRRTG